MTSRGKIQVETYPLQVDVHHITGMKKVKCFQVLPLHPVAERASAYVEHVRVEKDHRARIFRNI